MINFQRFLIAPESRFSTWAKVGRHTLEAIEGHWNDTFDVKSRDCGFLIKKRHFPTRGFFPQRASGPIPPRDAGPSCQPAFHAAGVGYRDNVLRHSRNILAATARHRGRQSPAPSQRAHKTCASS
jgi:hypothetical protein